MTTSAFNVRTKMIEKMLEGVAEETVYVTPVRQEHYTEPRYKHMLQGWLEFGRFELPEPINLGLQLLGRWSLPEDRSWVRRGPRLRGLYVTETIWDSNGEDDWSWEETHFCGWDELLHPISKRTRDIEVRLSVPVQLGVRPDGLELSHPHPSWVCAPLKEGEKPKPNMAYGLPPGYYHKIRVRNADGELLWEARLSRSYELRDNNTLTLTTAEAAVNISCG